VVIIGPSLLFDDDDVASSSFSSVDAANVSLRM